MPWCHIDLMFDAAEFDSARPVVHRTISVFRGHPEDWSVNKFVIGILLPDILDTDTSKDEVVSPF